jgi:hypothetical protein
MVDVKALARSLLDGHVVVDVVARLHSELVVEDGLSELEALERIDRDLPRLRTAIDRQLKDYRQRGLTLGSEWESSAKSTLVPRDEELGGDDVVGRRTQILTALSTLTGRQFEHVCALLLASYGLSEDDLEVTPASKDGGVDFVAIRRNHEIGANRLRNLPLRLVGQAKRYAGTVGPDDMDALVTRVDDCRRETGTAWTKIPSWFKEASLPIFGLFVTSSHLGPDATKSATRHGVFVIEGDQVAEDLVHTAEANGWFDPGSRAFNPHRFVEFFPTG